MTSQTKLDNLERPAQDLKDKVDGLENQSNCNHLRVVGIPESVQQQLLHNICQTSIRSLRGLQQPYIVKEHTELAQRDPMAKRLALWNIWTIWKNCHFTVLQRAEKLEVEKCPLLIFADYSPTIQQKCRAKLSPNSASNSMTCMCFHRHTKTDITTRPITHFHGSWESGIIPGPSGGPGQSSSDPIPTKDPIYSCGTTPKILLHDHPIPGTATATTTSRKHASPLIKGPL